MRIYRHSRLVPDHSKHDIGGLSPYSGKLHEVVNIRRHLSSEFLRQYSCSTNQMPRLIVGNVTLFIYSNTSSSLAAARDSGSGKRSNKAGVTIFIRLSVHCADSILPIKDETECHIVQLRFRFGHNLLENGNYAFISLPYCHFG